MIIGGLDIPKLDNVPRANWSIGTRGNQPPRYFTVHYNGPRVPTFGYVKGEKDQIRSDARYHMRRGAFGVSSGGDGIQYHGGTFSDGSSYLFRDVRDRLWHCGNYEGNQWSIAWHLPLGDDQEPTALQIRGLYNVIDAFRYMYPSIAGVNVKGHKEWKSTLCPGKVMPYILSYRSGATFGKTIQWFRTIVNANCRVAPDVRSAIALNGRMVTPAGTIFGVDAIVSGVLYDGDPTYVHRADGIGFYHMSVVQSMPFQQYIG